MAKTTKHQGRPTWRDPEKMTVVIRPPARPEEREGRPAAGSRRWSG
jgi:hypothetical protein